MAFAPLGRTGRTRMTTASDVIEGTAAALTAIRERHPLVHNITNYVVMNVTANALLALGASPVMAHAPEEVEEMVGLADALVLNIGTLSASWVEAMAKAARAARRRDCPIVLDPVGAGATRYRTESARWLMREGRPRVIRGNPSEILALSGRAGGTRGVDATATVEAAREAAETLAREWMDVVAVTGPEDFVTDGTRTCRIRNGHPLLGRMTGSGCVASALTGAFLAVDNDAWLAATAALIVLGQCGEQAAAETNRPGTFAVRLLDALDSISPDEIRTGARIFVS